jgi:hypothetical protein
MFSSVRTRCPTIHGRDSAVITASLAALVANMNRPLLLWLLADVAAVDLLEEMTLHLIAPPQQGGVAHKTAGATVGSGRLVLGPRSSLQDWINGRSVSTRPCQNKPRFLMVVSICKRSWTPFPAAALSKYSPRTSPMRIPTTSLAMRSPQSFR